MFMSLEEDFLAQRLSRNVRVTSFDSPAVLDIARKTAREMGVIDRVEFLVRLQRIHEVAAVFALQKCKTVGREIGMYRQRHGVAQAARIDVAAGVGVIRLQRGEDPAGRRGE